MHHGRQPKKLDGAVFFGSRPELERYLVTLSGHSYVCVLCRPDRTPFYVGKGVNRRVLAYRAEARQNHGKGESNQKPTRPDH